MSEDDLKTAAKLAQSISRLIREDYVIGNMLMQQDSGKASLTFLHTVGDILEQRLCAVMGGFKENERRVLDDYRDAIYSTAADFAMTVLRVKNMFACATA